MCAHAGPIARHVSLSASPNRQQLSPTVAAATSPSTSNADLISTPALHAQCRQYDALRSHSHQAYVQVLVVYAGILRKN